MKRSDMYKQMIAHEQMLRRSLGGEPSEETLMMWRLSDQHREMTLRYLEQQEAEEAANVNIKTEVRIKR